MAGIGAHGVQPQKLMSTAQTVPLGVPLTLRLMVAGVLTVSGAQEVEFGNPPGVIQKSLTRVTPTVCADAATAETRETAKARAAGRYMNGSLNSIW
jgi:hypothetical protein